jgi:hypothetical protein
VWRSHAGVHWNLKIVVYYVAGAGCMHLVCDGMDENDWKQTITISSIRNRLPIDPKFVKFTIRLFNNDFNITVTEIEKKSKLKYDNGRKRTCSGIWDSRLRPVFIPTRLARIRKALRICICMRRQSASSYREGRTPVVVLPPSLQFAARRQRVVALNEPRSSRSSWFPSNLPVRFAFFFPEEKNCEIAFDGTLSWARKRKGGRQPGSRPPSRGNTAGHFFSRPPAGRPERLQANSPTRDEGGLLFMLLPGFPVKTLCRTRRIPGVCSCSIGRNAKTARAGCGYGPAGGR